MKSQNEHSNFQDQNQRLWQNLVFFCSYPPIRIQYKGIGSSQALLHSEELQRDINTIVPLCQKWKWYWGDNCILSMIFLTTGDTQAEGDGKMNGSSSSSTVLPPHLKEHERPPLLVNCEVSLLHAHGKMLLIPWKYCGWDAQSQPEIAGNFSQAFVLCPWPLVKFHSW